MSHRTLSHALRRALPALWVALPAAPGTAGGSPLADALAHLQADDVLTADRAVDEIVACGPSAVPEILPLLDDPRRDVRGGVIRALGRLGDPRAAAPLRQRLAAALEASRPDDLTSRYHRILLLQAAGRLRDRDAVPLIRSALRSDDPFERTHSAIALFLLDADPGYDAIVECLADPDPAVRNLAVTGVGESAGESARELLLEATRDESWLVRDAAYRELARRAPDDRVREAFRQGAADPSWFVRETVSNRAPE